MFALVGAALWLLVMCRPRCVGLVGVGGPCRRGGRRGVDGGGLRSALRAHDGRRPRILPVRRAWPVIQFSDPKAQSAMRSPTSDGAQAAWFCRPVGSGCVPQWQRPGSRASVRNALPTYSRRPVPGHPVGADDDGGVPCVLSPALVRAEVLHLSDLFHIVAIGVIGTFRGADWLRRSPRSDRYPWLLVALRC